MSTSALQSRFEPPPADFPNGLAGAEPLRASYRSAWWLLLGIVILGLVLRVAMTWRIGGICPDAVLYIQLAQALEAGDLKGGLREMRINTFPVILMLLHRAGLDWEIAGQAWNVLIGSLLVLPLFGWIRRQFDDRVATVACLLVALHPKFIEWSAEIIRDPTFWFLFTLSVYLLWRAVTEVRIAWFLAAGLVGTLSALTRFEGWFLLILLAAWTFWRVLALRTARVRLLVGAALCVGALPTLLALVNLIWFRGQQFELTRLRPLESVQAWLQAQWGAAGAAGPSFREMLREFFPIMTRGLSPAFALLMLGGLWGWWKVWLRRDHQAAFYAALAVMGGIWMGLWFVRNSCPRYALSVAILASPFAALGLLGFTGRCMRTAAWFSRVLLARQAGPRLVRAAMVLPWALVVAISTAVVFSTEYELRSAEICLGRWVRERIGPSALVLGPEGSTCSVTYHGELPCRLFAAMADTEAIAAMVEACRPDVVLLGPRRVEPKVYEEIVTQVERLGLRPVDPAVLPAGTGRFRVLVRGEIDQAGEPRGLLEALPSDGSLGTACGRLDTGVRHR